MNQHRFGAIIRTSPIVQEVIRRDRGRGHVHVLSAFRSGLGQSPRSALQMLWHFTDNDGLLLVQANEPPVTPGLLGEVEREHLQPDVSEGEEYFLRLDRSCQKTPPSSQVSAELHQRLKESIPKGEGRAYRSRLVVVPEHERPQWLSGRLAAHGFTVLDDSPSISPVKDASLGGARRSIPYVSVAARVRVDNAEAAATALREGTGKGKNYGLGLIRLEQLGSDSSIDQ